MLSDNFSPNNLRPIFSHALSLKLETIKLDVFIKSYSSGQTLSGKVIQVLPEQKAVVEFQGQKLLLQFSRPVAPGQNIEIKVEQTHPNLILKLADIPSSNSSKKITTGDLPKDGFSSNNQASDKTSIQNRSTDSNLGSQVSDKNSVPVVKNGKQALGEKVANLLSKADLERLGIQEGQKVKTEVLRVVNRETLQARLNDNELTIKHATSKKLQAGDSVYIHAKPISSGKFVLAVDQTRASSSTQPSIDLSILKSYLPTRQPLAQVFAGLKKVFLDGELAQLKGLNVDLGLLKQLQANLQIIISGEFKAPDAAQLKEMINRSGAHYESRVKDFVLEPEIANKNALLESDLKGQLMRFARQLEQLPSGATESVAPDKFIAKLLSQVNQAVNNIELQQLVHHFSKEEQQPLLLQLPETLLGEEDRFKIYILPDQREGASPEADLQDRVFNLVFLLNLFKRILQSWRMFFGKKGFLLM